MPHPEIQPASRRQWWPENFIDEVAPDGRATPSDWLIRLEGGGYAYGNPTDRLAPPTAVQEGDVVEFSFQDQLGTSLMTLDADGEPAWTPPLPPGINVFWDGHDSDTICDTEASFAEFVKEYGEHPDSQVTVLCHWSERTVRCRFTAAGGVLRFLPVDDPPPPPVQSVTAPVQQSHGDLFSAAPSA